MFDVRLLIDEKTLSRSACALKPSKINHPTSNISRRGLTLIELLVVIIILTTLVAGVIPLLSPNNDERKIRTAARGLQTYLAMAQTEAARTGRPHGIAFRESAPGSGVALDVFALEVPQPFTGFSQASRVTVTLASAPPSSSPFNYGTSGRFSPLYNGFPIYRLEFIEGGTNTTNDSGDPLLLPPRMFRVGDEINVAGNRFVIVDDARNAEMTSPGSTVSFLASTAELFCVWINETGQVMPGATIDRRDRERHYRIIRQPTNSLESPYQLPSGIAIDLQGSGLEGPEVPGSALPAGSFNTIMNQDTVGILFSPTGRLESVTVNGNRISSMSRVFLLLGRVENGGLDAAAWDLTGTNTNEQIEEKQEQVNWLNLDSRWMMIGAQSGRIIVSENAFVNPAALTDPTSANEQIEAAHEFVHEMKR